MCTCTESKIAVKHTHTQKIEASKTCVYGTAFTENRLRKFWTRWWWKAKQKQRIVCENIQRVLNCCVYVIASGSTQPTMMANVKRALCLRFDFRRCAKSSDFYCTKQIEFQPKTNATKTATGFMYLVIALGKSVFDTHTLQQKIR